MELKNFLKEIKEPCFNSMMICRNRWDNIAKPLRSLGIIEEIVVKMAGIFRTQTIDIDKRCVVVMCADNGVVAQGVTQVDSIVTAIVAENFVKGNTSVCTMAKCANVDVIPVDIGINKDMTGTGIINKKIMFGTNDMTMGTAMTRQQAIEAIEVGINIVGELKDRGYRLIGTGEMGIGNTTSCSAIASVMLDKKPSVVTGRGAGLDSLGLKRKIRAIEKAIEINMPDKNDPIDILSKVGGLDIAGIAGLFIGGAVYGIPIIIDGAISSIAALIACQIEPLCINYMIASHVSAEPTGKLLLEELGLKAVISAEMCLGEGTGAVALLNLIDMGVRVYNEMSSFSEINIDEYVELE